MITSAKTLGFAPEAELRDRSQMAFLSSLMRQGADRYVLKGGMAMRALYASARLTKDIDFDCEASLSAQSMSAQIPKALRASAREAGLVEPAIDRTKSGTSANRWRLRGATRAGVTMTWDVELSSRGMPAAEFIETTTIQPPPDYRIARFVARVYGPAAMAASKVNALLSVTRSVPRDVFDLHELAPRGASPVELWVANLSRETLERRRIAVLDKINEIGFELANSELLPYVARDIRATIDRPHWDVMRIAVTETVQGWFESAIAGAKSAEELSHDATNDPDLAGR